MSAERTQQANTHRGSMPSFESYGGTAPENYERYFVPAIGAPLAADLADLASIRHGERVLDVACGTGVVAKLAAERVGPAGVVAGVDINPGMLAVARATTPVGMAIDWYEAGADAIPLTDGSFDVVLCQLGLQFFPDRPAALREMRRLLAPGGRLIATAPGPTPAIFGILEEGLARHVDPDIARFVRVVFSLHDTREIGELMSDAGFDDVDVRTRTAVLQLPEPTAFLWQYIHSTPLAAAVSELDDRGRATLERDVVEGWQPLSGDGGLVLELGVTTGMGRK